MERRVLGAQAQTSDLAATGVVINDLPDLNEILGSLNEAGAAYDTLGSNPGAVLVDAQSLLEQIDELSSVTLSNIISSVQNASEAARSALDDARDDSVHELEAFEEERRDLKLNHFIEKPEDIGFALLAEDINTKLYQVGYRHRPMCLSRLCGPAGDAVLLLHDYCVLHRPHGVRVYELSVWYGPHAVPLHLSHHPVLPRRSDQQLHLERGE